MGWKYILTLLCGSVACVRGGNVSRVECCEEGRYIQSTDHSVCTDGAGGVASIRFSCLNIIPVTEPYKVLGNKIQLLLSQYYKPVVGIDAACVGTIAELSNNGTVSNATPVVLLCQNDLEEGKDNYPFDRKILSYCMIVSAVFLALTAGVYSALSELRDLFGKSVINMCASLAISMGTLAIISLHIHRSMIECGIRGFVAYFFWLAAFFWSNSISIQVLRDIRRPFSVDFGWREFRWYMIYSWGVPAVLTVVTAVVNYHPGDHARPGIGLNTCWFYNTEQQWYYMYSVMSILILTNIGIFIYISVIVWRHTFSSTHTKALRYKFIMTIRLMVVMGVSWIFEMLSTTTGEHTHVVWAITDVFNTFQGVLMFLILVVFRKRAVKAMYRRGWMWCCAPAVERHLAVGDDAEQDVVQHTDIPMSAGRPGQLLQPAPAHNRRQ